MPSALFLTSRVLESSGFRHAFFIRHHGWSTGPYDSLNFSVEVGDVASNVSANFRLAAVELNVAPERICYANQVHGTQVLVLGPGAHSEAVKRESADAVLSRDPETACAVRTADCVPVLLADRATGAVGAVHAGWRGVVAGTVTAAVHRLRSLAGTRGDLLAAIGPHISQASFRVSEDVAQLLRACAPKEGVIWEGVDGLFADLGRIVRAQLRDVGVADQDIEDVGGCTVLEPDRYFSYRREGRVSGRHLSAIVARQAAAQGS